MKNDYYVYLYLRENGTPYYVGKGRGSRAYRKESPPIDRIMLVLTNLTEEQAFSNEKEFIKWYGRLDINTGILENKTDGGEGSSGFKHTKEYKERLKTESLFVKNNPGKNKSKETIEKIRKKIIELHKDPDYQKVYKDGRKKMMDTMNKEEISKKTKESMWKPEIRQRYLEGIKKRKLIRTEETNRKMIETKRKKGILKLSEETKKKISESHKNKKMSEETKKKISESKIGSIPWNKGKKVGSYRKTDTIDDFLMEN